MQISLAKPPTDAKVKEKRKLQHMLLLGRGYGYWCSAWSVCLDKMLFLFSMLLYPSFHKDLVAVNMIPSLGVKLWMKNKLKRFSNSCNGQIYLWCFRKSCVNPANYVMTCLFVRVIFYISSQHVSLSNDNIAAGYLRLQRCICMEYSNVCVWGLQLYQQLYLLSSCPCIDIFPYQVSISIKCYFNKNDGSCKKK